MGRADLMWWVACSAAPEGSAGPLLELPAVGVSIPLSDAAPADSLPAPPAAGDGRFRLDPAAVQGAAYYLEDGTQTAQLVVFQLPPAEVLRSSGLEGSCPELLAAASHTWTVDPGAAPRAIGGATLTLAKPHDTPGGLPDHPLHWEGVAIAAGDRCIGVSLAYDLAADARFRPRWTALLDGVRPL